MADGAPAGVSAALLAELAVQPVDQALATLAARNLLTPAAAAAAAQLALAMAPAEPLAVAAWLPLLAAWAAATGGAGTGGEGDTVALLRYVQARLALAGGDFAAAAAHLQAARARWRQAGDDLSLARGALGLTQLLAMQGRFDEAETEIRAAIAALAALAAGSAEARLLHLDAQQNLATLLSYQERHREALDALAAVRVAYLPLLAGAENPEAAADFQLRLGLVERDLALAHTYLDQPDAAETLLLAAVARLGLPEARAERGQARTNLGHLYNRTGRYAEALATLDAATLDLLGTLDVDSVPDRWPAADVLFLEQAALYLALNLLPEAEAALRRAQALFGVTGQQYELGQALYYAGVLAWRRGDLPAALAALAEAAALYAALDNPYWQHRVHLAEAAVTLRRGDLPAAAAQIDALLAALAADEPASEPAAPLAFDQAARCEVHLLDAQLRLALGDGDRAGRAVAAAAASLGLAAPDDGAPAPPGLHIHLLHTAGLAAQAAGDRAAARRQLARAVELIEAQRGLLPIEELRAAFLGDKTAIYAALVLSLLEGPQDDPQTVAAAFDMVERARSRSLLERLLAAVDDVEATAGLGPEASAQIAAARSRLAWLYNQLLGPGSPGSPGGASGSRGLAATISAELRGHEATLQRLEWQRSTAVQQVQPATLAELQAQLAGDQAAVVYFIAGEEVLAFVVTQEASIVVRDLTCTAALAAAQAQWRFQLGRVEIGGGYAERHAPRLLAGARAALERLHELLLAPLLPKLAALAPATGPLRRLLVAPYGSLHLVPFHALWDGRRYLLEEYEVAYAPSASLAVHHRRGRAGGEQGLAALAALALPDPAIPQAEHEVRAAARHFARAHLFLHEQAGSAGLEAAAGSGDVLHIATHGVFRPDNPFFSALKLADGWIDVRAIYRLPLAARLVVLSACESGAVQVQGSDEAIGLARGFLGAGAQALVVSLWNVHDASAAILMDRFYAHLAGAGQCTAGALAAAQREAAAGDRHPYYWAPYLVMGDL